MDQQVDDFHLSRQTTMDDAIELLKKKSKRICLIVCPESSIKKWLICGIQNHGKNAIFYDFRLLTHKISFFKVMNRNFDGHRWHLIGVTSLKDFSQNPFMKRMDCVVLFDARNRIIQDQAISIMQSMVSDDVLFFHGKPRGRLPRKEEDNG